MNDTTEINRNNNFQTFPQAVLLLFRWVSEDRAHRNSSMMQPCSLDVEREGTLSRRLGRERTGAGSPSTDREAVLSLLFTTSRQAAHGQGTAAGNQLKTVGGQKSNTESTLVWKLNRLKAKPATHLLYDPE